MVYDLVVEGMTFDISSVVVGERQEVLVLLQETLVLSAMLHFIWGMSQS